MKEVLARRVAGDEVLEPITLTRNVIDDRVKHQVVSLGQVGHVVPVADRAIHGPVVDHRKAVIGGSRVERQ